jgi:ubiquinone/menaquinone biosynthesis C-methylase UbiE
MHRIIDFEQAETQALTEVVDWGNRVVLEIGCGEGRLARRLAGLKASTFAIDPSEELVKTAVVVPTDASADEIRYCVGDGLELPFGREVFDTVLFGWSL